MRSTTRRVITRTFCGLALGPFAPAGVCAGMVPYPNTGTAAPTIRLTGTGSEVFAYFVEGTAGDREQIGLYINGALTSSGFVFPNLSTYGNTRVDLGFAPVGSDVIFALQVYDVFLNNYPTGSTSVGTGNLHYTGTPSYTLYSVPSDAGVGPNGPYAFANPDGTNHAYVTSYTPGQIPYISVAGNYVGFEDTLTNGASGILSDLNYQDEQFVVTGLAAAAVVPEPSSLALCGIAGAAGLVLRQLRRWRLAPA